MSRLSRRSLAGYGADQLLAGQPVAKVAKALAAALKESGKTGEAQFLVDDIIWELERRRVLVIGHTTSVHNLSPNLKKDLSAKLKQLSAAKSVILEEKLDKAVLGGLKVETSAHVWDETVARKLTKLRELV